MRGCQIKLGRMGTRGTEIWIQRANQTKSLGKDGCCKTKDSWQVTEGSIMKHFSDTNSHYKTPLQIISLFSVFNLTCLQVLPQSEVMYISSLYSTSWDPRLPEEKIQQNITKWIQRERHINFLLFNLRQSSNFLTLYDFKREGEVNVSKLHIKRVKLQETWRLLGIKGWELVRSEHFTERVAQY